MKKLTTDGQSTEEVVNDVSTPASIEGKAEIKKPRFLAECTAVVIVCLAASPAFAQLERATAQLTNVQTWLISIGVIVFTLAIGIVGYMMAFKKATWGDVVNIFFGGVLAGGAAGFAAFIFGV